MPLSESGVFFPLTPTLSLGEREQSSSARAKPTGLGYAGRLARIPPFHEPRLEMDGPLSPSKGERVPKAEEEAVQGLKIGLAIHGQRRTIPTNMATTA
jgi:hypothetical protein